MSASGPPETAATPRNGGGARTRLLALVAMLTTLVAGFALGWGASHWSRHRGPPFGRRGEGRPPIPISGRFLDRLDLTAAQRASIDSILERRRAQLDAFWSGPGQQVRLIVDSTRNEVRAVLTPAQRAVYDSIGERHRRDRGRGGGGPPPPGFGPR